jgi:hypothetical protein
MRVHPQNIRTFFGFVNPLPTGNVSDDPDWPSEDCPGMAKRDPKPDTRDPYAVAAGERLRTLREALGYKTTRALADAFNLKEDRVGTWERGVAMVPPAFLDDLEDHHQLRGLHTFVFRGDGGLLPHDLALKVLPASA